MKKDCEMTKFREGDTKEHEGVTYVAVRQKEDETCEGRAFYKRAEPCKSPEDWLCVEATEEEPKDLIFKKSRIMNAKDKKLFGWFLGSNRWKHFLYAIPAGAINFWLAIGLALGMEFKDAQHGGNFDWLDATCTAGGGFVGATLSWWLLGDYVLHYLIKLIF